MMDSEDRRLDVPMNTISLLMNLLDAREHHFCSIFYLRVSCLTLREGSEVIFETCIEALHHYKSLYNRCAVKFIWNRICQLMDLVLLITMVGHENGLWRDISKLYKPHSLILCLDVLGNRTVLSSIQKPYELILAEHDIVRKLVRLHL